MTVPSVPAPGLRRVAVTLLSDAGWIHGILHVPSATRLYDFVEHCHAYLPLIDAVFEGRPPIPFFAVRKKGIILTLVPADEDALSSNRATAETVEHQIHLLLACGAVTGRMRIAPNVRLSDHFAHKSSVLIALSDARLSLRDPASDRPIELVTPQLLVSSETLVGFSETPL